MGKRYINSADRIIRNVKFVELLSSISGLFIVLTNFIKVLLTQKLHIILRGIPSSARWAPSPFPKGLLWSRRKAQHFCYKTLFAHFFASDSPFPMGEGLRVRVIGFTRLEMMKNHRFFSSISKLGFLFLLILFTSCQRD